MSASLIMLSQARANASSRSTASTIMTSRRPAGTAAHQPLPLCQTNAGTLTPCTITVAWARGSSREVGASDNLEDLGDIGQSIGTGRNQ